VAVRLSSCRMMQWTRCAGRISRVKNNLLFLFWKFFLHHAAI
jgi:hypothetical protein